MAGRNGRVASYVRGRTALVTGGGSGLGRALAAQLAGHGAVVVVADVDGDAADLAARDIATAMPGATIHGHLLDVRDLDAFRAVVAQVGDIDLLFNNAGISLGGRTHELSADHWDRIIDVNVRGVVNGILAVYPRMVERRQGHIVNTASAAGLCPPPFVTAYATTKHAVVGLSAALRPEAALHGVRVSAFCPGPVDTGGLDRLPDRDLPTTTTPPVTPRAYLDLIGQAPVGADAIATTTLRQVARGRDLIIAPASTKALWWLQRMSPGLTNRMLDLLARRVGRAMEEGA